MTDLRLFITASAFWLLTGTTAFAQNSNAGPQGADEGTGSQVTSEGTVVHVTDKKINLTSISKSRVCGREANAKTDVCVPDLPLLSNSIGPANDLVVTAATACAKETNGKWTCWGLATPRLKAVVDRVIAQTSEGQTPFALGDNLCTLNKNIVACTTYSNYPHGYLPSPNSGASSEKMQRFGPFKALKAVGGSKSFFCVIDGAEVHCQKASASTTLTLPTDFKNPRLVGATSFSVCVIDDQGFRCASDSLYDQLKSHPDWKDAQFMRGTDQGICVLRASGKIECEAGAWKHASQFEIPTDLEPSSDFVIGQSHGCALSTAKKVRCWGLKSNPDLITVPVFNSGVIKIGVGDRHTCALLSSGAIQCWGQSSEPQLQVPATQGSELTVATGKNISCVYGVKGMSCEATGYGWTTPPAMTRVLTVAVPPATGDTACALDQPAPLKKNNLASNSAAPDAIVKCWGLSPVITEVPETVRRPKLLSVASNFACSANESEVVCWGRDEALLSGYPDRLEAPRKLVTGYKHACVLDNYGLACWGELQRDFGLDLRVPAIFEGRGAALDIAVGDRHSCVLTPTQQVQCWGDNSQGQLNVPPLDAPSSIAAVAHTTCATDNKGVTCWGEAFRPNANDSNNESLPRSPENRQRNRKPRHI